MKSPPLRDWYTLSHTPVSHRLIYSVSVRYGGIFADLAVSRRDEAKWLEEVSSGTSMCEASGRKGNISDFLDVSAELRYYVMDYIYLQKYCHGSNPIIQNVKEKLYVHQGEHHLQRIQS